MTKFSPSFFDATEISNMAAGGHSNMAVNGLQNRLITNNELLEPVLFLRSVLQTESSLLGFTDIVPRAFSLYGGSSSEMILASGGRFYNLIGHI